MERLTRFTWLIGLTALAFALAGCGGGGGGQSLTSSGSKSSGSVMFNVAWPTKSKTTTAVGSVDIVMTANGVTLGETTVDCPATSSKTIPVPASLVKYTVTTYSLPNKAGSVVSSAKGIITVSANKLSTVNVNTSPLISTSDNLTISSPTNVFEVTCGAQLELVATITDANGNVIPLSSAYNLCWSSADTTIATVDSQTGTVTGVKGGSVKITVTELTTGISTLQNITVDGLSARLFINGTQVADSSKAIAGVPFTYNATANTSLQLSVEGWYGSNPVSQIQTCWDWGYDTAVAGDPTTRLDDCDPAQPTPPTVNAPPTVFRTVTTNQHAYMLLPLPRYCLQPTPPPSYYTLTVWLSDGSAAPPVPVTINIYLTNNPYPMQATILAHPFDVTDVGGATPSISGWTWDAPITNGVFTVPASTDIVFLALATANYSSNPNIPAGPNGEVLQGSVSWDFGDGTTTAFQPFSYRHAFSIGLLVDPMDYGEGSNQFEPGDTPAQTDHMFTTTGSHTITAQVQDIYGNTSSTTYVVNITPIEWPVTTSALKRR